MRATIDGWRLAPYVGVGTIHSGEKPTYKGSVPPLGVFDGNPYGDGYTYLNPTFYPGAGATLYDFSRYGSHGAITTATWYRNTNGRWGLNFVAANPDYVTIPAAHTQLDFMAEDFSIIMRIFFDTLAIAPSFMIDRGTWRADGWYWYIGVGGNTGFVTNQALATQESTAPAGSVAALAWYTLGISRSGADVRHYVNGVDLTAGVPAHINPLTCASNCYVGVDWGRIRPIDGRIEFLRIFGGIALPASTHLWYYNMLK